MKYDTHVQLRTQQLCPNNVDLWPKLTRFLIPLFASDSYVCHLLSPVLRICSNFLMDVSSPKIRWSTISGRECVTWLGNVDHTEDVYESLVIPIFLADNKL